MSTQQEKQEKAALLQKQLKALEEEISEEQKLVQIKVPNKLVTIIKNFIAVNECQLVKLIDQGQEVKKEPTKESNVLTPDPTPAPEVKAKVNESGIGSNPGDALNDDE